MTTDVGCAFDRVAADNPETTFSVGQVGLGVGLQGPDKVDFGIRWDRGLLPELVTLPRQLRHHLR